MSAHQNKSIVGCFIMGHDDYLPSNFMLCPKKPCTPEAKGRGCNFRSFQVNESSCPIIRQSKIGKYNIAGGFHLYRPTTYNSTTTLRA